MRSDLPIIKKAARISALALLFLAVGCQQQDTSKEWKPIEEGLLGAYNTGNLELLNGIIDPQYVWIVGSDTTAVGLDSFKKNITSELKTYPDFHVTIDERIHAGDKAVERWSITGTHSGLGNLALKGKQINHTGISIMRMKNGKLVEEWFEANRLTVMLQLGYTLTPPSGTDE